MKKTKIVNAKQAAELITDGDCIAISAAGIIGNPDEVELALEERFLATGHPCSLSLYSGCGHGVPFLHEGDARFAHPKMLKRVICSHPQPVPDICKMIEDCEMEAYILPQGVLQQLYRAIAAKQPGIFTKIGIGTYIDPRQEGGKANQITKEDIVSIQEINSEEYLFYKSFPVTAAIIRGTTADTNGNISIEHEALKLEILEIAMAAKARHGKVIVQVERLVASGTLSPKNVVVPGELVDAVVVTTDIGAHHRQTAGTVYNPYLSGELRAPEAELGVCSPKELSAADIVCRRAAFELYTGAIVNVGVGIGAGIGAVAKAEGIDSKVTFTLEHGAVGGTPQSMDDFGASENASAYIAHASMFDFIHGGGLDLTFLGVAQIDKYGNVNVSKIAGRMVGQGGFIDISQSAKKVVFCTYFSAKGLKTSVRDGKLSIDSEGKVMKLVDHVEQITFSAKTAISDGKEVLYITERAVFRLTPDGLTLIEIAPGIDLEKDIIDNIGFRPLISGNLKIMDDRIFTSGLMGLSEELR